mmetsp:Transcript_108517/g.272976  ORF Transcript_108517/g.272976 Transcript_108517/m.272976 type:complete len:364 (+) Transcript_108517:3-1094(+)
MLATMPLLVLAGFAGFAVLVEVHAEQYAVIATLACVAFAAPMIAVKLSKSRMSPTPLGRRLDLYHGRLLEKNPCPQACEPGPGRAVRLTQILDLHDFFKTFIQRRNMHYLEANVIRGLTSHHRLSYAEVAGPSLVDWFVSHCWLHPVAGTCSALEKHARGVASSTQWRDLAYWICTLSNNQYDLPRELGNGSWVQSSFYLALQDAGCQGTCMILDEQLFPFGRSWCLFELLTSILKSETGSTHQSVVPHHASKIMFCTSTGILNRGEASVEVALNIGKQLSQVRLENAVASVQADKDMIDQLVVSKMGSFDKINRKLQTHMMQALEASRAAVVQEFEGVLGECSNNEDALSCIDEDIAIRAHV